jgi:hypothetical protein
LSSHRGHNVPGYRTDYSGGFRCVLAPASATPPTAALEPGAIQLWNAPEKITKQPGIEWADDALHLHNRGARYDGAWSRDAIIRASIRTNPDASGTRVSLRHLGHNAATQERSYFLSLDLPEKRLHLALFHDSQSQTLQSWPLPRAYGPDEWARVELRAVGDALTVSLDGAVLGTVHDTTLTEPGAIDVWASANGYFRDIVYVPLDKVTTQRPSEALEPNAIKLWDSPAKIPKVQGVKWEDNALRIDGHGLISAPLSRDAILRASIRANSDAQTPYLNLRGQVTNAHMTESYALGLDVNRGVIALIFHEDTRRREIQSWPLPRIYQPNEWVRLEFRAIGEELTISVEGQRLGTVRDTALDKAGAVTLFAAANGYFRDIVYVPLDQPVVGSSANSPSSTPASEPWQDVLHDPAKLELIRTVERTPEGLRFSNSSAAKLQPGHGPHRDGAVRMRSVFGDIRAQLRVRDSAAGRYQLYANSANLITLERINFPTWQPTNLQNFRPSKPFQPGQAYELELRMVGQTLTAKLDGNVLGTTTDGIFSEGNFGVSTIGQGAPVLVSDLEVLDLDAPGATASSATTPASATKDAPFENSLGMKFVPVPIISGPTAGQPVLFSVWDTRVQDYEAFVKETKRDWPKPSFPQDPTHPAVNVSWEEAQLFCQWLTAREQAAGRLPAGFGYRLPGDHEWSCAADLGAREDAAKLPAEKSKQIKDAFPWGTEWPPPKGAGNYAGEEFRRAQAAGQFTNIKVQEPVAGYDDGFITTSPVGSFPANRFGLYDLGGNVLQWCEDWFDLNRQARVQRGASWINTDRDTLLSSTRYHSPPGDRNHNIGFRCVLAPTAPQP